MAHEENHPGSYEVRQHAVAPAARESVCDAGHHVERAHGRELVVDVEAPQRPGRDQHLGGARLRHRRPRRREYTAAARGLLAALLGFAVLAVLIVAAAEEHVPDVIVSDIRMPPDNRDDGLRAGLMLRTRLPGTGLVILSQHLSRRYAVELLSSGSGGVGYLWKQRISDATQFAADVRTVAGGGTVLDPDVTAAALERADRVRDGTSRLTRRQREVLTLVARGLSNSAIAAELFITEKSVVEHVSNVYDVLGIAHTGGEHRRVLAVLQFLSNGPARTRDTR